MMNQRVAILGASDKKDRYSYKALDMLKKHGHTPIPVSPSYKMIAGINVQSSLDELSNIDTLTIYVKPAISSTLTQKIIQLNPKRVIFNPGTENKKLAQALESQGISTEEACTLVLLSTNQF